MNPILILNNVLYEFFYIGSAVLAQNANFYYGDYFSLAYWFGDIIYRFIITTHPNNLFKTVTS